MDRHGLPAALYPDRHSIHRRNDKAADEIEHRTGVRPPTRFGQAMAELGVELICAHSPQAKGRVERMNPGAPGQDRLVKLLKLEGITTIDAANAYLDQTFLAEHNARFAVEPADTVDAHRPPPAPEALDATLCPIKEPRALGRDGCVCWRGRRFQLSGPDATAYRHKRVEVRQHLDGRIELLAAGRLLRYVERAERPPRPEPIKPPLARRLAAHVGPVKPSPTHPWRSSPAVAGSATARCARLRYASHRNPTQGTVLLS